MRNLEVQAKNKERALAQFNKTLLSEYHSRRTDFSNTVAHGGEIFATLKLPLMLEQLKGTSPDMRHTIKRKQSDFKYTLDEHIKQ